MCDNFSDSIGNTYYNVERGITGMVSLNIDRYDCTNAAKFIEIYFFQNIRDDEDMDNLEYLRSLLRVIDELKRAAKDEARVQR